MADDQRGNVVPLQPEKWVALRAVDAQAILNYLANQKCNEVYGFVTTLLNLKECDGPRVEKPAEKLTEA